MARMFPSGARTQVLPLYTIPDDSTKKFTEAIESAKFQSDLKYYPGQAMLQRKEWDGDNERVWNTAQKLWDVFWEEDGSVSIGFEKPYVKHRNGVEWIYVPEAEKNLPPPVSALDIAKEIINQLQI